MNDLARLLAGFTGTPGRCYFAIWDGYGHFQPTDATASATFTIASDDDRLSPTTLSPPPGVFAAERLHGLHRDYLLYTGSLSAVTSFSFCGSWLHSPNLWWPEDRAWCIATDIDLDSTYVGGSEPCIDALLEHRKLEALPTAIDSPTYATADTLNSC